MAIKMDLRSIAYSIWIAEGSPQGRDLAHWQQAVSFAERHSEDLNAPPVAPVVERWSCWASRRLANVLKRKTSKPRATPDDPEGPEDPDTPHFRVLSWKDVLTRECQELGLRDASAGTACERPTALCLSGGGIRSAAFCIGAITPLLHRGLLQQFHYLSTVSGGGYVGAWLTRAIAETGKLDASLLDRDPGLAKLRRYSNFLTPTPGPVTLDSWAAAILWIRNTLINWTLLLPMLLGVAAAAQFLLLLRLSLARCPYSGWVVASAGLACLSLAIHNAILSLPSHITDPLKKQSRRMRRLLLKALGMLRAKKLPWRLKRCILTPSSLWAKKHSQQVMRLVLAPSLLWALLLSLAAFPELFQARHPFLLLGILPLVSVVVGLLAYAMARCAVLKRNQGDDDDTENWRTAQKRTFCGNLGAWFVSCICSGLLLWAGLALSMRMMPVWWTVLGPPWVVASEAFRSTIYVLLRREGLRMALDREWLARLNGDKLRYAAGYLVLTTTTLAVPMLVIDAPLTFWHKTFAGVTVLSTGPAAALLGKSASTAFAIIDPPKSAGTTRKLVPPLRLVLPTLSLIFILTLLALFGTCAKYATEYLATVFLMLYSSPELGATFVRQSGPCLEFSATSAILIGCMITLYVGNARVKINRFSMHAAYAFRLIRAFLGTARPQKDRNADPYTDFDPEDNARVSDMFDRTRRPLPRLFPVINATLNTTRSGDSARAERKAVPFTITPLHCGSRFLNKAGSAVRDEPSGAYVPTTHYAGGNGRETGPKDKRRGLSLGTAMAISGAALSPNMGYYSSSLTAFVMTLFNLRLGAWLPNPGMTGTDEKTTARLMHQSSPNNALWPMLQELFGITRTTNRYVYLSDGGHFDNLGLYEMLRRRCMTIVAIDAGRDENYAYIDLGRALQHVLIDAGITVEFIKPITTRVDKLGDCGAYAKIVYPEDKGLSLPEEEGRLLYLKPYLPDEAPTELQAFQALKQDFPHASTADQFFTESDFESYRRLGEYLMTKTLEVAGDGALQLEALFDALARKAVPAT